MAATKVLVVDDSLTMRALLSGALERIPNVEVVGLADGADEAREMVRAFHPDVMTLDVEMPGMSGIDYLREIMETRPMPVIMFSTRTTDGAAETVEALRLGAIDCFPKPKVAAPGELDAIISKLGKRLKTAKNADLKPPKSQTGGKPKVAPIDWNGRLLVIGGDSSSTSAMFDLFSHFSDNCPPTLVVQHLGPGLVETMAEKLAGQVAPKVVMAQDGMKVEQGHIYFAPSGDKHVVVDAWPDGHIRFIDREPVLGERPSISMLFASAAKAAGAEAVGTLFIESSEDGGTGIRALNAVGAFTIAQAEESGYTLARRMANQPVAGADLAPSLLKLLTK
jgi:two-component system, chemotaxis family, protein-glutamate methylesterase/glutaminase